MGETPTGEHNQKATTFDSDYFGGFHLSPRRAILISCGFLVSAMLLCVAGKSGLNHAEQTKSWPSVPAAIWNVERHEHSYSEYHGSYYTYTTTVWYEIGGKKYKKKFGRRLTGPVRIFHSPSDPSDCVLEPGVESENTNLAFFGALFLGLFGVVVLLIGFSPTSD